jgi:ribosomal protein S6
MPVLNSEHANLQFLMGFNFINSPVSREKLNTIMDIDNKIIRILILKVGHRKNIYD